MIHGNEQIRRQPDLGEDSRWELSQIDFAGKHPGVKIISRYRSVFDPPLGGSGCPVNSPWIPASAG